MDNLTHTLFAVTLARTPLGRAGRGTTAALVIASNIPDIDIVTAARGGLSYLQWHRGPTHGPLSIIGLGIPTAGLVWLWRRLRDRGAGVTAAPSASYATLVVVSMIGVALHLAMDFPTAYGTRLLSPFDWHWFALDWMPIIDVYLLAALTAGLLLGATSQRTRGRNAAIVFMVMAANDGVRAAAHHEALVEMARVFESLPGKCDTQERPRAIESWPSDHQASDVPPGGQCLVEVAAMPTFLSPFTWRVIAQLSNGYDIRDINLIEAPPAVQPLRRVALHFPNEWTPPVVKAAESHVGRVYLGFSRFPSARAVAHPDGTTTVSWTEMRFVGGVLRLDQPLRRDLFTATVRLDAAGRVVEERFGP